MYKSRQLLLEVLVTFSYSILFCGIFTIPIIYVITNSYSSALTSFILIVVAFILMVLRRKRNFIFFLLSHTFIGILVPVTAFYFTGDLPVCFAYSAFMIASISFSYNYYISGGKTVLSSSFLIVVVVSTFAVSVVCRNAFGIMLDSLEASIGLIIFVCYLIYWQISNIDHVLLIASKNTTVPISSILKFNNRIALLIISGVTIFLVLSRFLFIESLLLVLLHGIKLIWKFLISLIPKYENQNTPSAMPEITEQPAEQLDILALLGEEVTEIEKQDYTWLFIIIFILLFFGLVYSVFLIIKKLYFNYVYAGKIASSTLESGDTKTFIGVAKRTEHKRINIFSVFFGQSNSEKVNNC